MAQKLLIELDPLCLESKNLDQKYYHCLGLMLEVNVADLGLGRLNHNS
jgi:hypothetical protein